VRSSLKKRMLIIDEAWSLMQHEDSAKFLFGLVKRARKYYLGVTTITQDVEDFVSSAYGKPIITNSSLQLLLKQSPSAIEPLTKIFNLTEGEKYMLLNSGVGQGLFFAGLKHVAIQVIASFSEDKIVTTNPEELLAQNAVAAEFETDETASESEVPAASVPATSEAAPVVSAPVVAEVPVATPVTPAVAPEPEQEPVTLHVAAPHEPSEEEFTENVAAVLDQPIEAPTSVVVPAPVAPVVAPVVEAVPVAPVAPTPSASQEVPVVFGAK
jgi:hypothetical protein